MLVSRLHGIGAGVFQKLLGLAWMRDHGPGQIHPQAGRDEGCRHLTQMFSSTVHQIWGRIHDMAMTIALSRWVRSASTRHRRRPATDLRQGASEVRSGGRSAPARKNRVDIPWGTRFGSTGVSPFDRALGAWPCDQLPVDDLDGLWCFGAGGWSIDRLHRCGTGSQRPRKNDA